VAFVNSELRVPEPGAAAAASVRQRGSTSSGWIVTLPVLAKAVVGRW